MPDQTTTVPTQVGALQQEAEAALAQAHDLDGLRAWKTQYLGDKGAMTLLARQIGQQPPAERPAFGQAVNRAKTALQEAYEAAEARLRETALDATLAADRVDVSLPGRPVPVGTLHVITQTTREILAAFVQMGFQIAEGPEIELDEYNFGLLNIPPEHPARSMHDTFYVSGNERLVARTHTSPNQIRVMRQSAPPIRVVVPGRTYRAEATDATHEAQFSQIEGLAVDEHITLADLKGTLAALAHALFGPERKVRFRCDYFPYVEPGVDLAIQCLLCGGSGCKACKYIGYLEVMGAGIVHPQVLRNGGIDPERYSGFAFGLGPERVAMLRHGIDDIRLFYNNDLRFLRQFGGE